ncbi:MAG: hypothetical protein H6598_10160 [Flavobacteriales bacterium]|nr:hypothetical protein [Flavobacteriales bacterium]
MNFRSVLVGLFLIFIIIVPAQKEGERYIVDSGFKGNLFYNTQCNGEVKDICVGAEIEVVKVESNKVKVKIISSIKCENYAVLGSTYCVSKAVFTSGSVHQKAKKWEPKFGGGVLSVPFKFDMNNFKTYPAGEVGTALGLRLTHIESKNGITFNGILGWSTIPLNDLNSSNIEEIKTVSGATLGFGLAYSSGNNFIIGAYLGWDFYNTNNTPYTKNWISFGIGYDFFHFLGEKKNEKERELLNAEFN